VTGRDRAAAAPVTAGADGARRFSSLPRRIGALAYEALLLAALALVAGFVLLPFMSPARVASPTIAPVFVRTMMFCVLTGGAAIYYGWFWSEGRRTLPQKTWRLRLVDVDGGPLSRATALVRYAAGWIGPAAAIAAYAALRPAAAGRYAALLLLVNYAWALIDTDRQFLHDRIAGTQVVDDPAAARHTA
jgi:uncharacterized RDD family membrane protein YckC